MLKAAGCNSRPEPHDEFCLHFSERVVRRYLAGELTFIQADQAVNWLFAHCYVSEDCPGEMPELARSIFEAFDAGEFRHQDDSTDIDPEKEYTLPQIREIIGALDFEG